jgi:hypothetical protein
MGLDRQFADLPVGRKSVGLSAVAQTPKTEGVTRASIGGFEGGLELFLSHLW